MESKGTFGIQKLSLITMEFMLYILSRGLLTCNQPSICRFRNKASICYCNWLVVGTQNTYNHLHILKVHKFYINNVLTLYLD